MMNALFWGGYEVSTCHQCIYELLVWCGCGICLNSPNQGVDSLTKYWLFWELSLPLYERLRSELSSVEYSGSHSTQTMPDTHACWNLLLLLKGYSLQRRRRETIKLHMGVQTYSEPPVSLVPFRMDLVRMSSTPQPNLKWLLALEIKARSLDQKHQPLIMEPFLAWTMSNCCRLMLVLENISHTMYLGDFLHESYTSV